MRRPDTGTVPDEEEWSFGLPGPDNPLPPDAAEREACMIYEYARSSPTCRALTERFRVHLEKAQGDRQPLPDNHEIDLRVAEEAAILTGNDYPVFCALWDHRLSWLLRWPRRFPQTPWVKIPSPERRAHIPRVKPKTSTFSEVSYRQFAEVIVADLRANPPDPALPPPTTTEAEDAWRTLRNDENVWEGLSEYLVVKVNWAGDRDALVEDFRKWLKHERWPKGWRGQPTGENLVTDSALRWLAIMRILHAMSFGAAKLNPKLADILLARQGPSVAVRTKVKTQMAELFGDCIPAGETPLGYATWTEQKRGQLKQ